MLTPHQKTLVQESFATIAPIARVPGLSLIATTPGKGSNRGARLPDRRAVLIGVRGAGRFAKAAFDRGRSEMPRVAQPEPWF